MCVSSYYFVSTERPLLPQGPDYDKDEARPELLPFSRWLRAAASAQGLTVRALGRRLDMSASGVSQLLRAMNGPSGDTVQKMARLFGVDPGVIMGLLPQWRMEGQMPKSTLLAGATEVVMVPVLDQEAGAGRGVSVLDYVYVSPAVAAGRKIVGLRVRGDCMAPKIEDGDTLIIDQDASWQPGRVVVARIDDRLIVKRAVGETDGQVLLRADNPSYQPREIEVDERSIVGIAIEVNKAL